MLSRIDGKSTFGRTSLRFGHSEVDFIVASLPRGPRSCSARPPGEPISMDRRAPVRHSLISCCLLHIFRILSRKDRKSTFRRPRFASDIRKLISHVALDLRVSLPRGTARAPVRHSLISCCLLHIFRILSRKDRKSTFGKTSLCFGHSEVDFIVASPSPWTVFL